MKQKPAGFGTVRVFVYGTLKQGGALNGILRGQDAKKLGFDSITGQFNMVNLGAFPAVMENDAKAKDWEDETIRGEIWSGDEAMLEALDFAEGHPDFYVRQKLWTDLQRKRVWVYMLPNDWEEEAIDVVDTGIWHPSDAELAFWKAYNNADNAPIDSREGAGGLESGNESK